MSGPNQTGKRQHGLSHHPLYRLWSNMRARCEFPEHKSYPDYGGRGITVCAEWHDVAVFIRDIEAEIGPRPPGMTLDRIDNDGPYAPGNVCWATRREQNRKTRRTEPTIARRRQVFDFMQRGMYAAEIARRLGATRAQINHDLEWIARRTAEVLEARRVSDTA